MTSSAFSFVNKQIIEFRGKQKQQSQKYIKYQNWAVSKDFFVCFERFFLAALFVVEVQPFIILLCVGATIKIAFKIVMLNKRLQANMISLQNIHKISFLRFRTNNPF